MMTTFDADVKIKLDKPRYLPTKAKPGDSCYDTYAAEALVIPPGESALVDLGFSLELPPDWEAQLRPRSGLTSKRRLAGWGTIDSGYRGNVKACIINLTTTEFSIGIGDRVAQMTFARVPNIKLTVVDAISDSERGAGGFGSTGVQTKLVSDLNTGTDS